MITDILVGAGVGIVGLLLVFGGYAFARVLLTIWGLIFGFVLGGAVADDFISGTFLNISAAIILGIIFGLLFAGLAYAFYYLAVILAGAAFGFAIGAGFLQLFGVDPNFITAMLGIAGGVIVGLAFIVLNLPRAFLIVVTSLSGAVLTIGGLLVMFGQIPYEYFNYQAARVVVDNSWFWSIGAFILAIFGMVVQSMVGRNMDVETWQMASTTTTTSKKDSDTDSTEE